MAPPSASEPTSPMNTCGGIAVEPEKAERRAHERPAEDRELARPLDVQDAQVLRGLEVAGEVRDDREGAARRHDGPDGEPVEAVGQVHRVRRAHDHEDGEGNPQPAEGQEPALEEGNGERRS